MKYLDEFRNPEAAKLLLARIARNAKTPVRLMEFCGGHTHAILKTGLRQLLPPTVRLLSGPGCPVCVTSSSDVGRAIAMALLPRVILTTFGDMVRVPGSQGTSAGSLQEAKAQGADVRIVYSTLDALAIARANPDRPVIFLGVGFETTAPTVAAAILQAQAERLCNFYVLSLHKLTPPATRAILNAGEVQLSGIIGPGHVTTIIGADAWRFLPCDYGIPCAIAGFEPLDILQAICSLVTMIERGTPGVSNDYARSVRPEGNRVAQQTMQRVFQVGAAEWRGLGMIPNSGLLLRDEYTAFDAARQFPVPAHPANPAGRSSGNGGRTASAGRGGRPERGWSTEQVGPGQEPKGCRCGEVLRGVLEPRECALFARACTPEHPIGPCMVSGEGACAAYMQYGEGQSV